MEIVRFAPGRRNAGTWRLGIIWHADKTKITSVTKEIKYTIYDCFVGDIAFKVSQTAADMIEINANHFKIKRKSSEHSTQNLLFPFKGFTIRFHNIHGLRIRFGLWGKG